MNSTIRTAAAMASILGALALPLAAGAATTAGAPPQHYDLQTQLTNRHDAGAYTGRMLLTVYPNGIVQGTYRPDDGRLATVTGGVDGTKIWLDIGMRHPLHVSGTFQNGVLRTTAALPGIDVYEFDSAPQTVR